MSITRQAFIIGVLCVGLNFNVPIIQQRPNECEITSLTELLVYEGYDFRVSDLYAIQPKANRGDPNHVYINGYYCFEDVLKATASKVDVQLESTEDIYLHMPCIVWGTLDWTKPRYCKNGLYKNLHCVVLKGADLNYVYLADPLYGEKRVNRKQFEDAYELMGSRNLCISH